MKYGKIEKAHLKGELSPESYSNDAYTYYTAKQAALARTACCLNTSRDDLQYLLYHHGNEKATITGGHLARKHSIHETLKAMPPLVHGGRIVEQD